MTNHDLCKALQELETAEREVATSMDMSPERTANWRYAETAATARSAILQQAEEIENYEDEVQARLAITRAREADIAQLRGELANATHDIERLTTTSSELATENECLRAEIERLATHNERLRKILTQAPIAKVTVIENSLGQEYVTASLYAPGLPPGEYDLYLQTEEIPGQQQSAQEG